MVVGRLYRVALRGEHGPGETTPTAHPAIERDGGVPRARRTGPRAAHQPRALAAHPILPDQLARSESVPVRILVANRAHGRDRLFGTARHPVRARVAALIGRGDPDPDGVVAGDLLLPAAEAD